MINVFAGGAVMLLAILILGGCSRNDSEQPAPPTIVRVSTPSVVAPMAGDKAPTQVVDSTPVSLATEGGSVIDKTSITLPSTVTAVLPTATAASPTAVAVLPTATTAPQTATAVSPPLVLLPLIRLPDVLVRIDGCEPLPRFSVGVSGGTVPWPTPTPGAGGTQESDLADAQFAVFRGIAAGVVRDAEIWTSEVASEMESTDTIQEVMKLGWVLARVVAPMCSAMSIAPWPEKYESFTTEVADLLIDASKWGREALLERQPVPIDVFRSRIRSISIRATALVESFADVESVPIITGSNSLGFFLATPAGWHVTRVDFELRIVGDYDSQLALLESVNESTFPVLAGMRVRAIRRISDSSASDWIANGELLFPGYRLEDVDNEENLRLTFGIDGARAKVDILAGELWIYYVQTVCSEMDPVCLEFVELAPRVAEFR